MGRLRAQAPDGAPGKTNAVVARPSVTVSREFDRSHRSLSAGLSEMVGAVVIGLLAAAWGLARRPALSVPLALAGGLAWLVGWGALAAVALLAVTTLVCWLMLDRRSFRRMVGRPFRNAVRRLCVYEPRWRRVMRGCKLTTTQGGSESVPKIKRVRSDKRSDRLLVRLLDGQSPEDLAKAAEGIRHSYRAEVCRVTPGDKPGTAWVALRRDRPLQEIIAPLEIPDTVDLAAVAVGECEDGRPWTVQLLGTHILVGGATGAGKASVLWSLLRGIAPDIRSGLVQVYAADPKGGAELKWGRELFVRYEDDTLAGMLAMLREVVALMEARSRRMAGVARKHTPTLDEPMLLVVVDEVVDLIGCEDAKLKAAFRAQFELLLRKGRAVGVTVMLLLQEPRKEAMPFRGLIPDGIALRLKERGEVDMVLGPGAYAAGALCTQIKGAPGTEQGIGYVLDSDGLPIMVRASFVADEDIQRLAGEYAPRRGDPSDSDPSPELVAALHERWAGPGEGAR